MKKLSILFIFTLLCVGFGHAQQKYPPMAFGKGTFKGETTPLRDEPIITESEFDMDDYEEIYNDLRRPKKNNPNALPMGPDPLNQTAPAFRQPAGLILDFQAGSSAESGFIPPDPTGAVGPNHFVHAFNSSVKIFDKTGTLLVGPVSLGSFLGNGLNHGDPIVMYDQLADRWFVSQFECVPNCSSISSGILIMGVSTSPDPTGTYNVYEFPLGSFPDYPHYAIWPDGYYLTANKSGQATYVFQRDVMLAGDPDPLFEGFPLIGCFKNPNTVFSPEPANLVGTNYEYGMPGYIVYLQDDAWSAAIANDHIKIWTIEMDWDGDSTISNPQEIALAPFDSTFAPFGSGDIGQPGTGQKLDGQGGIISYMANFRKFDDHNSFVINFNVDIDGNDTAGVRWIELRNTGSDPFTLHQEGTWTIADGDSRFMGSNGIDEDGNIGLGYSVGSSATRVGLRFTGRMEGDPLGQMTFPETSVIESNGVQTWINRYGDYAHQTIDIDDRTFWYTSEYIPTTNTWADRVGAYKLVDDYTDDLGVYAFVSPGFVGPYTNSETVEVNISNFGTDPQSNFDVELYVDGGLVDTETYTGTLNPGETDSVTFSQTIDLSIEGHLYEVVAKTALSGDDYPNNDDVTKYYLTGELLGTNDFQLNDHELFMYPVSLNLYELKYNTTEDFGVMNYRILNLLGQEVTSGKMETEVKGYRASVDLNTVATGVYVVEVSSAKQKLSKQFMVSQ
ncbi:MAG TPA: CARDB domain-containing protein [Flavobacteriaceae bacterium]|nr:T9SS type A sorting domain-containing protein [Flavobacteriaceae bacterium]MCB9213771.1 T9SS type A sorting domain-containing protein [Alteromonas sp.]HPF11312.1 CARDB domain-containing protein [Flavobacteriaceae bacterium]HQU64469.1 CARDB domain-containing protein [Flavobacteriaceae bacterium]HRW44600.1 CARDB domain-containing protein [Flavobacteriaceae bacterium]